jgi:hypothetical protein
MFLFLSAQDINFMEVGLLEENGRLFSFQKIITPPENFLSNLSSFLYEQKVSWEIIKKIVVVSGPGSFTSTRLIVTIANAISFARKLPIVGITNSEKKNSEELIIEQGRDWAILNGVSFVSPVYDRPPNITIKKM